MEELGDVRVTVELDKQQEDRITALENEASILRMALAAQQQAIVVQGETLVAMKQRLDTLQTYFENGWTT